MSANIGSQAVGYVAGGLTTACVIPQIVHAVRSGSSKDLSYLFVLTLVTGLTLWLVYGIMIDQIPVIIPNAISLALNLLLLIIKSMQDMRVTMRSNAQEGECNGNDTPISQRL